MPEAILTGAKNQKIETGMTWAVVWEMMGLLNRRARLNLTPGLVHMDIIFVCRRSC